MVQQGDLPADPDAPVDPEWDVSVVVTYNVRVTAPDSATAFANAGAISPTDLPGYAVAGVAVGTPVQASST